MRTFYFTTVKETSYQPQPPDSIINAAKYLDKHYITTRYPNGLVVGSPEDYFTKKDAKESIENARGILEFCDREISALR